MLLGEVGQNLPSLKIFKSTLNSAKKPSDEYIKIFKLKSQCLTIVLGENCEELLLLFIETAKLQAVHPTLILLACQIAHPITTGKDIYNTLICLYIILNLNALHSIVYKYTE